MTTDLEHALVGVWVYSLWCVMVRYVMVRFVMKNLKSNTIEDFLWLWDWDYETDAVDQINLKWLIEVIPGVIGRDQNKIKSEARLW